MMDNLSESTETLQPKLSEANQPPQQNTRHASASKTLIALGITSAIVIFLVSTMLFVVLTDPGS